jgi:hypothetical protein
MYLRNVKQYVKNAAPAYDERRYGFANFLEAVRAAGRAGLFRLERNRQGILRIFAGSQFPRPTAVVEAVNGELPVEAEVVEAAPVLEAVVLPPVEEIEDQQPKIAPPVVEEDIDDSIGNRIGYEPPKAPPVRRRPARAGVSAKKKPAARKPRKKSTEANPRGHQ